ncbi:efflux RND transporter permease subunit [bacterium]|nr:efflux RND transporter permease subunit [bacterium]
MIQALIDFCIRERLIVFLIAFSLTAYGWYSFREVPIDAIPNVSENQVIVLTEWPGRSPKDIEDQITYPLSVALQSVAGAESVRGKSMFGFSFVQVTFADNVDFYWARSRVSEQLSTVGKQLPEGTSPALAPDATALGQIYYYVLDPPLGMNLADVRSKQDYVVKYALQSVDGVAEVASIGGYVKQYQVEIDPDQLRVHQLTLGQVLSSVRDSNIDVGAKTIESSGMEYLVRGVGFIGTGKTQLETLAQIEQTVIATKESIPVTIGDVASVQIGPAFRRGALDWNGSEAVGGVVVMRYGENPRQVIERVKARIAALEPELGGIKIKGIYDRTELVDETIGTLTNALWQEIAITMAVIVLFLLHVRASLVVATTLPVAVLMAFIAMNTFGVDANIMSLAGIAIAIGTMVDMGIIISENIFRGVADWEESGRPEGEEGRLKTISKMTREVAPAVVTAVSTTVISFLPVFFLTGRDYRLFAPLAWTKTFSLVASLIVAVLLVPPLARILLKKPRGNGWVATAASMVFGGIVAALSTFIWSDQLYKHVNHIASWCNGISGGRLWDANALTMPIPPIVPIVTVSLLGGGLVYVMLREKMRPVEKNLVARLVNRIYEPTLRLFLRFKRTFLVIPLLIVFFGVGAWIGLPKILSPIDQIAKKYLGADFNGSQGYVDFKHTFVGLSSDDWIALDEGSWFYMPSLYPAASLSQAMRTLQTQDAMIRQIPEVAEVLGKIGRAESALDPAPAAMIETYIMLKPKSEWRNDMTEKKIWAEINKLATLPGITVADELQPIEGRVVMLQSGIKASMAIRIYGDNLQGLAKAADAVASTIKRHPMVNADTVSPDIVLGKPYIEFEVDRKESARYGMTVRSVNEIIESALGGKVATTTVEGRQRYGIQVRYQRSYRDNISELIRVPVVTKTGEVVPLGRLATLKTTWGPAMVNSEDARLVAHVAFAPRKNVGPLETVDRVMESLTNARKMGELKFPEGNFELEAVGSFQNQIEANRRLMIIIPLVLALNIFIIYLQFRRLPLTLIVFAGIPVAFGGGMIALSMADVQLNTAVWIGFIALFGIAIDDGVVIATYLDQVLKDRRLESIGDIRNAVVEAGLKRIRPCLMTTFTTVIALLPVLYATGRGADVARAMAIPVFGGMVVELITLFVVPVVYCGFLEFKMNAKMHDDRFVSNG